MDCRRRNGVFVAVLLLAASCSGDAAAPDAQEPRGPAIASTVGLTATPTTEAADEARHVRAYMAESRAGRVGERSTDMGAPFGIADVTHSAAVKGLRVPLGPNDLPGPLHEVFHKSPGPPIGVTSPVYDMCDDAQAYEAVTGEEFVEGAVLPYADYVKLERNRPLMGCDLDPDDPQRVGYRRWRIRTNEWGSYQDFKTREAAHAKQAQHLAAWREAHKNTIEGWPRGHASSGIVKQVLIEFADAGSPLDEVRLLEGSLDVSEGVLRGFMRNWSRTLWAYGATVTSGDKTWQWPLSMQPGEIAPFEIDGWDGPSDPSRIEVTVTAEMSPRADLSRSFLVEYSRTWWGNTTGHPDSWPPITFHGVYPQHVIDTLPSEGDEPFHFVYVTYEPPPSHPSFPAAVSHAMGEPLGYRIEIDDLRVYFAYVEVPYRKLSDEPGDVERETPILHTLRRLPALTRVYTPDEDAPYGWELIEITKLPLSRNGDHDWTSTEPPNTADGFETVFHDDAVIEDPDRPGTTKLLNTIMWVGGAHRQASDE